jgi:hypothetical protein
MKPEKRIAKLKEQIDLQEKIIHTWNRCKQDNEQKINEWLYLTDLSNLGQNQFNEFCQSVEVFAEVIRDRELSLIKLKKQLFEMKWNYEYQR